MTNLSKDLVTDDYDVVKETRKIKTPEDTLDKIVIKSGNPHQQLWHDYINDKVSVEELHRTLRGKLLKSIYKMRKQKYPPKPTEETPANMEGWIKACTKLEAPNAGNKYWLGVLLKDIIEGKLEAEPGKEEEIEELLSEWY